MCLAGERGEGRGGGGTDALVEIAGTERLSLAATEEDSELSGDKTETRRALKRNASAAPELV